MRKEEEYIMMRNNCDEKGGGKGEKYIVMRKDCDEKGRGIYCDEKGL